MQSPREVLHHFFAAENSRDWETYQIFLDREVIWKLHGAQERTIRGIEEYLSVIQQAYQDSDTTFVCLAFYQSEDKSRAVAILRNSLGEISCDSFSFRDGKICAEEEFLLG